MQSSPIVNILTYHQRRLRGRTLRKLFQTDPHRGEIYQHKACGLLLDLSKNLIDNNLLYSLINLVNEAELDSARQAIFAGKIVNRTETVPPCTVRFVTLVPIPFQPKNRT